VIKGSKKGRVVCAYNPKIKLWFLWGFCELEDSKIGGVRGSTSGSLAVDIMYGKDRWECLGWLHNRKSDHGESHFIKLQALPILNSLIGSPKLIKMAYKKQKITYKSR